MLRIQPLRAPRDENVYECVARNSEGEEAVTAKLAIIRGERASTLCVRVCVCVCDMCVCLCTMCVFCMCSPTSLRGTHPRHLSPLVPMMSSAEVTNPHSGLPLQSAVTCSNSNLSFLCLLHSGPVSVPANSVLASSSSFRIRAPAGQTERVLI